MKINASQIADTRFTFYVDSFLELLPSVAGAAYYTYNGALVPYVSPTATGLTAADVLNLISIAENDRTIARTDASGYNVAPTAGHYPNADAGDSLVFAFSPSGRKELWFHNGTGWSLNSITTQTSGEATYMLTRATSTANVAPTLVEVQGRYAAATAFVDGDNISVTLSDGTIEWWEVVSGAPVRRITQASGGVGRIVAQTATVAAFPAASANNGNYSLLTATDGANVPGLYKSDGATWALAKAIDGGPGRIVAETATVAAFPAAASNTGHYSMLTMMDGTNMAGLYKSDGTNWNLSMGRGMSSDTVTLASLPANVWTEVTSPLIQNPTDASIKDSTGAIIVFQKRINASNHLEMRSALAYSNLRVTLFA